MANNIILSIKKLSHLFFEKDRSDFEALNNISFEVRRGEFLSIVGPSGCGKSTLLRIIAGLIKPSQGFIELSSQKTTMVFQNFAIFPWLNVYGNIEFGLKMIGVPPKERQKIVKEKIKEVDLNGFEEKYPKELSGGMRQRVGIARALALNPELLLMDEPFSNLDSFTAEKLRKDLLEIWQRYKMTIIMVTHLVEEAVELSTRVLVASNRPAKIKLGLDIPLAYPRNQRSPEFYQLIDKITALIK